MKRNNKNALYEKIVRNIYREAKQTLNEGYSHNIFIRYAISDDCRISRWDLKNSEYMLNIYGQATTIYNSIDNFRHDISLCTGLTTYDLVNNELWIWLDEDEKPEDTYEYKLYPFKRVEPGIHGGGPYAIFDISNWKILELSEWDYIIVEGIKFT